MPWWLRMRPGGVGRPLVPARSRSMKPSWPLSLLCRTARRRRGASVALPPGGCAVSAIPRPLPRRVPEPGRAARGEEWIRGHQVPWAIVRHESPCCLYEKQVVSDRGLKRRHTLTMPPASRRRQRRSDWPRVGKGGTGVFRHPPGPASWARLWHDLGACRRATRGGGQGHRPLSRRLSSLI